MHVKTVSGGGIMHKEPCKRNRKSPPGLCGEGRPTRATLPRGGLEYSDYGSQRQRSKAAQA